MHHLPFFVNSSIQSHQTWVVIELDQKHRSTLGLNGTAKRTAGQSPASRVQRHCITAHDLTGNRKTKYTCLVHRSPRQGKMTASRQRNSYITCNRPSHPVSIPASRLAVSPAVGRGNDSLSVDDDQLVVGGHLQFPLLGIVAAGLHHRRTRLLEKVHQRSEVGPVRRPEPHRGKGTEMRESARILTENVKKFIVLINPIQ